LYAANLRRSDMSKVILITGGSRGIGAATSLLAAAHNYSVVLTYRTNISAADEVVNKINNSGGKAISIQGDVAREEDILRIFSEIDKHFGRLDALVNNAGIVIGQSAVANMSAERITQMFETNVIGPFLCSREAVKRMSLKRGGNGGGIVNVSSTAIKHGAPFEYVDYAASKAALEGLTIGLAKEVAAEGIRVNAVRPGIIDTEIHASGGEPDRVNRIKDSLPMKRAGTADEVAKAITWLLSDEASYCSGSIIDVSGGR
jgi:NAD(P)-dependent dehydrogenase (short-subunit alcohol dehydrogenase family)